LARPFARFLQPLCHAMASLIRRARSTDDCMILPTTSPSTKGSAQRGTAAGVGALIFLGAVCFAAVSFSRSSPLPVATEASLDEHGDSRRLDESVPVAVSAASHEAAAGGGGTGVPAGAGAGAAVVLPCSDSSTRCAEWAAKGECGRNSIFMHKQCAASCGTCEAQAANNGRQEPEAAEGQAERCRHWAASGECRRNPRYMQDKCRGACPLTASDREP
jgi:hypothetical protein